MTHDARHLYERSLEERMEANANLVLWCVHVIGPDDVYAEPSHAAAVAKAAELNRTIWAHDKSPDDVLCFAYADMWPWSTDAHAESMKDESAKEQKRRVALTSQVAP